MNIETNPIQTTIELRHRRGILGLRYDQGLWRAAAGGIWTVSTIAMAVGVLGAPTGFGTGFDVFAAILLNVLALALSGVVVAWLLNWVRREIPPLAISSAIYTVAILSTILVFGEMKVAFAIGLSLLLVGIGAGSGWLVVVLTRRGYSRRKKLAAGLAALLAVVLIALTAVDSRLFEADPYPAISLADMGQAAEALTAKDPSLPGIYDFQTLTYGSGTDKHRSEFGDEADLISATADASFYTQDWSWLREQFWGFDESELPLNGRVWMPEGEGPWPLVLMVHGNHLMEDYSDEGYDYLGELLASRGFIAVSVDENFLNYSVWGGIPNEDMKLRAWLLLKHIGQLENYSEDPSSELYGAIDFDRVALLGHSRGGQAVAMAADRNAWFDKDNALPDRESYRIRAVVAVAPTDTTVDGKTAHLQDITYMTLQGSEDADVSNFYGERQYERTFFTEGSSSFKTSLYIGGANHGQFNASWGARDEALPIGLFLKKPELSGEEQRQIAKAYVSALLETTLHDDSEYKPLFQDYRSGVDFLPDTSYFNRYEDSSFVPVSRYEVDSGYIGKLEDGATAEAAGMDTWKRTDAVDRQNDDKGNKGVVLGWKQEGASYSIEASDSFRMPTGTSDVWTSTTLDFSMANMSWQLDDPDISADEENPDVRIEAEDASGASASVDLDEVMPVQTTPRSSFTWLGWPEIGLGEEEYSHEVESVFQTYRLPLSKFEEANPQIDWNHLQRITFYFEAESGRVMLDDIGFSD